MIEGGINPRPTTLDMMTYIFSNLLDSYLKIICDFIQKRFSHLKKYKSILKSVNNVVLRKYETVSLVSCQTWRNDSGHKSKDKCCYMFKNIPFFQLDVLYGLYKTDCDIVRRVNLTVS